MSSSSRHSHPSPPSHAHSSSSSNDYTSNPSSPSASIGDPQLNIITDHLDIWTAAETPKKAGGRGRAANTKKSPHGIKKLRELILELAVRGKLVPQDPADEPASVLLEKIAAEKERLVKEGKIKKSRSSKNISEEEIPFTLPSAWKWARMGDLTLIQTGKLDANASSPDGEYPFFTCAKDPLRIDRFAYDCECVLLAGNGNFDVNYYSGKFDAYQRTYIIEPVSNQHLSVPYLFMFMQRYSVQLREISIGGVIQYIKIGFLTDALLPIPPLAIGIYTGAYQSIIIHKC